jgi:hypothetical protein
MILDLSSLSRPEPQSLPPQPYLDLIQIQAMLTAVIAVISQNAGDVFAHEVARVAGLIEGELRGQLAEEAAESADRKDG